MLILLVLLNFSPSLMVTMMEASQSALLERAPRVELNSKHGIV